MRERHRPIGFGSSALAMALLGLVLPQARRLEAFEPAPPRLPAELRPRQRFAPRRLAPRDSDQVVIDAMTNWQRTQYSRALARHQRKEGPAPDPVDFVHMPHWKARG